MQSYGEIAVAAVKTINQCGTDPRRAWDDAATSHFPTSKAQQGKGCPRAAFLGLCSEGLVAGVPRGTYTSSIENRRYAATAANLIRADRTLISNRAALWERATAPKTLVENHQLDVVLALWAAGSIVSPQK